MLTTHRRGWARGAGTVLVLGLWLAVGAMGGQAQGRLSLVQTNDAAAFLPASAESTRAAEQQQGFVDDATLPVLTVVRPADDGQVDAAQLAAVTGLVDTLPARELPGADPAAGDPATLGDVVTAAPVVAPSEDGAALLVPVSLDAAAADRVMADGDRVTIVVVQLLRDALAADLGATAHAAGDPGLNAWVTGPGGYVADLVNAFGGIDGVLLLVALVAVLVILVLVYRSPLLPLMVMGSALFALCAAALVVYHLADAGVLTLNGQAQGILSILVVGASVDYALFVVSRYREELRHEPDVRAAMRRAVRACLPPVAASAGTVVAGLLCLLLSDLRSNRSLGPVAAIGIASAFVATFTLLPTLLLVLGRRSRALFWPRVPHLRDEVGDAVAAREPGHRSGGPAGARTSTDGLPAGLWGAVARFVGRRARPVWVVITLVLVAFAALLPTFPASGTSQSDVFLTDVDAVAGEQVLTEHFPAGAVQPAVVIAPEGDLAGVIAATSGVEGVTGAAAYAGGSTGAPAAGTAQGAPRVVDGHVLVEVTTRDAADTRSATETVERLRTAVHAVSPGSLVGGAAAQALDAQTSGARDLRVIVPLVLAVIVLILMMLLRSVVSAVVLLLANVLSFAAALGVSALVFDHVLDYPGADPAVPLYAFTFLVAFGVDYSIFLMTRVREEAVHRGSRLGVLHGLAVTGGVITSAGLVLAATFAALGVIPLLFLAQLAFIVAFGVLLDTLVVRSLLVPAVAHDLGRATWWPSRLSRSDVTSTDAPDAAARP